MKKMMFVMAVLVFLCGNLFAEELTGKVLSVDNAKGSIVITYRDVVTGEDISTTIETDTNTKFENAGGIAGIKTGQRIKTEYTVDSEGSDRAVSITVLGE